ncbi:hypothetical protein LTS18_000276 [Coniosporium uncinatum]|uniref:Uncharacterized protein n=1 Tax=Coniosporium uncinatum TaxID=93489 RepID=A0ACC3DV68_9PEZI|nr:hypothetical protein LTS18_000276 [Coniosporium uncinatum]
MEGNMPKTETTDSTTKLWRAMLPLLSDLDGTSAKEADPLDAFLSVSLLSTDPRQLNRLLAMTTAYLKKAYDLHKQKLQLSADSKPDEIAAVTDMVREVKWQWDNFGKSDAMFEMEAETLILRLHEGKIPSTKWQKDNVLVWIRQCEELRDKIEKMKGNVLRRKSTFSTGQWVFFKELLKIGKE